jgi:hypothetical protein
MKKTIIMILMLLTLVSNVFAVSGLDVSVAKYDPYPATPGQEVKVWILIQNTGDDDLKDVSVEVLEQSPFSVYGDDSVKKLPILGAHKDYLLDFNLRVDSDALDGTNSLKVIYSHLTGSALEKDLDISVQARDSTLSIEKIELKPFEIAPGTDGVLTITVKNNAQTALTDVSMKLVLQSIVGSSIVDLPFAPIDSGIERRLFLLNPGNTAEFSYTLRAYPDATSKVYKIPLDISYYDNTGELQEKTDYAGVIVNGAPELSVVVDETDLNSDKKSGSVTFKIINKGVSDIKFLNIVVKETEDFELLSNSGTIYVGNLVSDDYQTAEYVVSIESKENDVKIPVILQYRDANNKYYETNYNVDLKLIDSKKLESGKSGSGFILIVFIVVALAGFWYYKRSKKKAKSSK